MSVYTSVTVNMSLVNTVPMTSFQNGSDIRWCSDGPEKDEDETYKHFYEMAQLITGLFIYPMVCFPGVIGNALTIFVLSRRNMQTSTNAFLSALAVADSIKLINDILYFFVIVFMRTSARLGNLSYGYLYPYAHFVFSLSVCVSSWLTVSVAVERYILVCHPTRARAFWSRKRAVFLCTAIYVIMTSLALPSAFRYRTVRCVDPLTNSSRLEVELTEMWKNKIFVTSYTWTQNLLRSIIPLLVLVVLNACIISALRRTKAKRRKNARHRVTVMMIVVILAFLICITPDAILSTVFDFGYTEAGYLAKGIREITDTLLAINAGVNFLIYCAFNQVFRKSFTRICCPNQQQSSTWITELDESTYRRLSEAKSVLSSNNNSPPRQDTPPTIVTDPSPTGNGMVYIGSSGGSRGDIDSCEAGEGDENKSLRSSSLGQIKDYESSLTSSLTPPSQQHQTNQQHTHRGSSNGLKKSRNSIKCNRARNRSNVVTFSDCVDTINGPRHLEKRQDLNDLDKDDPAENDADFPDLSQNLFGHGSSSYCKGPSTLASNIQNNILKNTTDGHNSHTLKDSLNDPLYDAKKLENLRNCDGTSVSAPSSALPKDINDTTSALSVSKNLKNKTYKVCLKDRLANSKKKNVASVSFPDSNDHQLESNYVSTNDNRLESDNLAKEDNSLITQRPFTSENRNESSSLCGETTRMGDNTTASRSRPYVTGEILMTDL